jgi:hypothetical protein
MPQIHTLLSSLLLVLQLCTQHNSKTHRVAATGMRPASHSTEPTHTLRKIPNQTHAAGCAVARCCTCSPSVKTAQTVQLCKAPACLSLAVRSRPVGKLRYNQSPLCMHMGWPSNCACGGKRHSALPRHIHSQLGQAPVVAPFGRKTPVGALCLNSTHSNCQPTICITHSVRTCHPHTGAGHSRTTHVRCWCC